MQELINIFTSLMEMPFESIGNGTLDTIIGILLLICYAFILFLIAYGIYWAIDSWWRPHQYGIGVVRSKEFTPAHTETLFVYNAATKSTMPQIIHHPDCWTILVELNGDSDSIDVGEDMYDSLAEGKQVQAEYVTGRLSNGIYLKNISKL